EKHGRGRPDSSPRAHFLRRLLGLEHGQGEGAGTGRRGNDMAAIGNGLVKAVEDLGPIEDFIGVGGRASSRLVRPSLAGPDQTKLVQSAIEHGAGAHADVLRYLGFDENDVGRDIAGHGGWCEGAQWMYPIRSSVWTAGRRLVASPL